MTAAAPLALPRQLTRHQREALLLAANGNTNAWIANRLGINEGTVSGLLSRAYRRLGATDRTQAVAVALRMGVLRLDEITLPETVERSA